VLVSNEFETPRVPSATDEIRTAESGLEKRPAALFALRDLSVIPTYPWQTFEAW